MLMWSLKSNFFGTFKFKKKNISFQGVGPPNNQKSSAGKKTDGLGIPKQYSCLHANFLTLKEPRFFR